MNEVQVFSLDWAPPETYGEFEDRKTKGEPATALEALRKYIGELILQGWEIISVVNAASSGRLVVHETVLQMPPEILIVARRLSLE